MEPGSEPGESRAAVSNQAEGAAKLKTCWSSQGDWEPGKFRLQGYHRGAHNFLKLKSVLHKSIQNKVLPFWEKNKTQQTKLQKFILEEEQGRVELGAPNSAFLLNESIYLKICIIHVQSKKKKKKMYYMHEY